MNQTKIWYEVRFRIGVYHDHYKVEQYTRDFYSIEGARDFKEEVNKMRDENNGDIVTKWWEKISSYNGCYAGIKFDIPTIIKMTEEIIE